MQKIKFKSSLLQTKSIQKMTQISETLKKAVFRYEELNTTRHLNIHEKKEKVFLKDYIATNIKKYKQNPEKWIDTYTPSCIK